MGSCCLTCCDIDKNSPHYSTYSFLHQLVFGHEPNISHLRTFGCAVQVPIALIQRTKMGPQCRLGIYVGYNSQSIIRFLKPLTGDLFTTRFADCHFDETQFPSLGTPKASKEEKQKKVDILFWRENDLTHLDQRTLECEKEVQRIIHLQEIANRLPDAFNDAAKVTKSHIPVVDTPARIYVPEEHKEMNENVPRQKRGRPIGSKDAISRKKRGRNQEPSLLQSKQSAPKEKT